MGRILQQVYATNVQLDFRPFQVLSNALHVIKVRLQILMDQDANHVPTDSSSHRKGVHGASNAHLGTYSQHWVKVLASASTGSMPKIVRMNSF